MIGNCTRCPLWQSRTQVVEGAGALDAPLMIVGEAPGRDEDLSGVPFVGQSGRLLRALLSEVYPNGKAYITNANKCRPPDNRTPTDEESAACRPYLIDEIRRVNPKVILAVGKSGAVAVSAALTSEPISPAPLVVATWHPAYVLRQPSKKPELRKAIHEAVALALGRDPLAPVTPAPWTLADVKSMYPFPDTVGMDTETDDLEDGVGTRMVGWSISDGTRAAFVPVRPVAALRSAEWVRPDSAGRSDPERSQVSVGEVQRSGSTGTGCDAPVSSPVLYQTPSHETGDTIREPQDEWSQNVSARSHESSEWSPGVVPTSLSQVLSGVKRVYLHNSKYDLPHLGIDPWELNRWDDTLLMAYVLRLWPRVGLKTLGPELTGVPMEAITSIIGTGKNKRSFSSALAAEPTRCADYAARDALVTKRLGDILEPHLRSEPDLWRYYHDIEKPMVPILLAAEQRGILIDRQALEAADVMLESQITTRRDDLAATLGIENPASGQQLALGLTNAGLALSRTTETGLVQVDKESLLAGVGVASEESLDPANGYHALVSEILAFRKLTKLRSTYVQGILDKLDPDDALHPRFNQAVTSTNRLSSSDPNAQNIPARTKEGAAIRAAFLARPGFVLVKADFSQLQLRIFADYVRDPVLLAVYPWQGPESDFHQATADAIGINRKDSKNVNFAVLFGAEEQKLAETAHVPRTEVATFLKAIRDNVPSLLAWKPYIASLLARNGFVTTRLGWREYYPQFFSPIRKESAAALREAACLPIQGTEAGVVKATMIEAVPLQVRHSAYLLLQVHDEMVYEVPTENVDAFVPELIALAAAVGRRYIKAVPLRLNVETGPNWRDTIPWTPLAMPQGIR